jgi:hypothetical protein
MVTYTSQTQVDKNHPTIPSKHIHIRGCQNHVLNKAHNLKLTHQAYLNKLQPNSSKKTTKIQKLRTHKTNTTKKLRKNTST